MKKHLSDHEKQRRRMRREIALGNFPSASTWKCAKCAKPARDWHHTAYAHWNDVIALCQPCHKSIHRAQRRKKVYRGKYV